MDSVFITDRVDINLLSSRMGCEIVIPDKLDSLFIIDRIYSIYHGWDGQHIFIPDWRDSIHQGWDEYYSSRLGWIVFITDGMDSIHQV